MSYDWQRMRGYHPPACTCVRCVQARQATSKDEELRATEYARPPNRPPQVPSGARRGGRGHRRRRGFPLIVLLFVVLVGAVVGTVLYLGDLDIVTTSQSGEPIAAALAPTEESPADTTAPTLPPTTVPTPTSIPVPHLRHLAEKQYMLELINQERDRLALPLLELGTNNAVQLHAQSALEHCISSHWGVDGLKPYMRYSLAGGYQANGENASGLNYCYKASDGYRALSSIRREIQEAMSGWMSSPGHRANILGTSHKKVNIGLAWNTYNLMAYQHFEGDYVEYTVLPKIEDGDLSFDGQVKNDAIFGVGQFYPVLVNYDPPPHDLTRGQISRTYCYDPGRPVAFLRKPLLAGGRYTSDTESVMTEFCPDPYARSADALAPSSPAVAVEHWRDAHSKSQRLRQDRISVPAITASGWRVSNGKFSVKADLSRILDIYGPGVYTVSLWGQLGGVAKLISEYSIFHEIPAPAGYD